MTNNIIPSTHPLFSHLSLKGVSLDVLTLEVLQLEAVHMHAMRLTMSHAITSIQHSMAATDCSVGSTFTMGGLT
jgi:hypothetical protein